MSNPLLVFRATESMLQNDSRAKCRIFPQESWKYFRFDQNEIPIPSEIKVIYGNFQESRNLYSDSRNPAPHFAVSPEMRSWFSLNLDIKEKSLYFIKPNFSDSVLESVQFILPHEVGSTGKFLLDGNGSSLFFVPNYDEKRAFIGILHA
jgi:hypothetical protein